METVVDPAEYVVAGHGARFVAAATAGLADALDRSADFEMLQMTLPAEGIQTMEVEHAR